MKDTIFYVGGGKGGVGKSMVSITLVQYLIDRYGDSKTIHLIETDESNPDVGRIYKRKIPVSNTILDEDGKGWILMSRVIENSSGTLFVINSAARSNMGIRKNGRTSRPCWRAGRCRMASSRCGR
jgi:MinD-like ATPase involved in chromosome partitioning or flagellar assembly